MAGGLLGPLAGKLGEVVESGAAAYLPRSAEATQVLDLMQRFGEPEAMPAVLVCAVACYVSRIESGRAATPHVAQLLARRLGVEITAFTGNRDAELAWLMADGQTFLAKGDAVGAARAFTEALRRSGRVPLPLAWSLRHALVTALADLGQLGEWRVHQEARCGSPPTPMRRTSSPRPSTV